MYIDYVQRMLHPECTGPDKVAITAEMLREGQPYITKDLIDGNKKYIFDTVFLANVIDTLATGTYSTFSNSGKSLMDRYIQYINEGVTEITKNDVLALDQRLGELL